MSKNDFKNRIKVDNKEVNKNYRIYATGNTKPWTLIKIVNNGEEALQIAEGLNPEDYNHYLIIEHDFNGNYDFPYEYGFLNTKTEKEKER